MRLCCVSAMACVVWCVSAITRFWEPYWCDGVWFGVWCVSAITKVWEPDWCNGVWIESLVR